MACLQVRLLPGRWAIWGMGGLALMAEMGHLEVRGDHRGWSISATGDAGGLIEMSHLMGGARWSCRVRWSISWRSGLGGLFGGKIRNLRIVVGVVGADRESYS